MNHESQEKLRIPLEADGRFDCIGTYGDGNQFMAFVVGAFPGNDRYPGVTDNWQERKSWNAVVHRFDANGNHLGSEARRGGFESQGLRTSIEAAEKHLEEMLAPFHGTSFRLCDIHIKPFSVEIEDVIYELEFVPDRTEDGELYERHMTLWPNDVMFHPPWDSGEYST